MSAAETIVTEITIEAVKPLANRIISSVKRIIQAPQRLEEVQAELANIQIALAELQKVSELEGINTEVLLQEFRKIKVEIDSITGIQSTNAQTLSDVLHQLASLTNALEESRRDHQLLKQSLNRWKTRAAKEKLRGLVLSAQLDRLKWLLIAFTIWAIAMTADLTVFSR